MFISLNRIKLTLGLLFICSLTFSQKIDSLTHTYYAVGNNTVLNLDLHHTELIITQCNSDSIGIYTNISVIPDNPTVPDAGIINRTTQTDESHVSLKIDITDAIQPHNEFKAYCNITIPSKTHLIIKNKYGIININAPQSQLEANISYTNLNINSISEKDTQSITSYYSTIKSCDINHLIIKGENSNFTANKINKIETDTKFTIYNIEEVNTIQAQTYTDKFLINKAKKVTITGGKSICFIDKLSDFLQCELNKGKLRIQYIDKDFNTINLANTGVHCQLSFDQNCHFYINADMRYCSLTQDRLTLKEVKSPNGTLYKGSYNKQLENNSNVSIISNNGDVSIQIKE